MAKEGGVPALICLLSFLLCFGRMVLPLKKISNQKAGRPQLLLNDIRASPAILQQAEGNGARTWCMVKPSTSQEKLDDIIEYCCTQPKVDCKAIQAGGMCCLPPNKISDASVVMNMYYNVYGKHPFKCDFKESGLIVTQDPSVDKCIYQE